MKITIRNGKAHITSPYNTEFIAKVKEMGGRWDASNKTWAISQDLVEEAREIMRDVYGMDDQQTDTETTDVRIKFVDDVESGYRAGINIMGREIAKAWGRDTGARTGDGVVFVAGKPESGGSANHWKTIIPAGCEIVIKGVPVTKLESEHPKGVEIV